MLKNSYSFFFLTAAAAAGSKSRKTKKKKSHRSTLRVCLRRLTLKSVIKFFMIVTNRDLKTAFRDTETIFRIGRDRKKQIERIQGRSVTSGSYQKIHSFFTIGMYYEHKIMVVIQKVCCRNQL